MSGPSLPSTNPDADESSLAPGQPSAAPGAGRTTEPVVPDYELIRRIGGGAYGEVWLARSQATGALRAAKIVWRHTFENDRPFNREFEGIQRFEKISREHPSQLALFHIGRNEPQGYFYYVMELADDAARRDSEDGGLRIEDGARAEAAPRHPPSSILDPQLYMSHTLRADLDQGRLPAATVLEIGLALTEALSHLHRNGLVHRDVKPSNVIFVNGRPKLADIGLVTDASDQCSIVGTEGYLPPEGPGTAQADIFALGKVLYEASTGMDRREFPDLPASLNVWTEAAAVLEMNQVVLRACEADPRARYQSAEKMQQDLLQLKDSKSLVRTRRLERRWRNAQRIATWMAGAAAAVGLLFLVDHGFRSSGDYEPTQRGTNAPVHWLYSEGRTYLDRFEGAADLRMAAYFFTRCTNAEPMFAPAYGCLAYTYTIASYDGWNYHWKDLPKAREYALEGLKHGDVAEAHLALGWYLAVGELRWQEAQSHYETALALQSSSALCHFSHAEFLRLIGHAEEGLKELNVAMRIEPHPKFLDARLPAFLVDAKHYADALAAIEKARDSIPSRWLHETELSALCALGKFADAIEMDRKFRLSTGELEDHIEQELAPLRRGFAAGGANGYWQTRMKMTQGFEQTCCYAQAGEKDKALIQLKTALQRRDRRYLFLVMTDWRLDDLRSDTDFQHLLKDLNLPRPMSEGGPPPPPPVK